MVTCCRLFDPHNVLVAQRCPFFPFLVQVDRDPIVVVPGLPENTTAQAREHVCACTQLPAVGYMLLNTAGEHLSTSSPAL